MNMDLVMGVVTNPSMSNLARNMDRVDMVGSQAMGRRRDTARTGLAMVVRAMELRRVKVMGNYGRSNEEEEYMKPLYLRRDDDDDESYGCKKYGNDLDESKLLNWNERNKLDAKLGKVVVRMGISISKFGYRPRRHICKKSHSNMYSDRDSLYKA